MIKNFIQKKGDALSFRITYLFDVQIDSMEFGVKTDYSDEDFKILKTIGNGITKVDFRNFVVNVSSSEMDKLNIETYVYDVRTRSSATIKTPLSGKIIIRESVFNG